jgi:hypothetical protein
MASPSEHDSKLRAIQEWFGSLPTGTAEMSITSPSEDPGGTHVEIQPLRDPTAANIRIRIDKQTGFLTLGAGLGFGIDDTYWPDMPFVAICQSIVSGGISIEAYMSGGELTAYKARLEVNGKPEVVRDMDLWTDLSARLMRRRQRHNIHYGPY